MTKQAKIIGITLGDPGGIGPEITAKALQDASTRRCGPFLVIGSGQVYRKYTSGNFTNCSYIDPQAGSKGVIKPGKASKAGAQSALSALAKAVDLLKAGHIAGLVTAPVAKGPIKRLLASFEGHTEYLANSFAVKNVGMMFVAGKMRTILVTRHIPLKRVSSAITSQKILDTILLTTDALRHLFRITNPSIGVCGINPHAGEGGTIGTEEATKIHPAIKAARRRGIDVQGPFAADTLFSPEIAHHYDTIIAMYHDQGLIPVKTLCFKNVVNLTVGLPFIRTSPAHGTAYNIAGTGRADASSMKAAIKLARQLIR